MRLIAALLVFALGLALAPSSAAAESTSLSASASRVSTQVVALISDYEERYGPRVSSTDRATLRTIERNTRREMNTLVRLVREAERTKRPSAWTRAYEQFLDIEAASNARLDEMRDIIEPKMSWTEKLGAVSPARSIQRDMESLGSQLKRRAR